MTYVPYIVAALIACSVALWRIAEAFGQGMKELEGCE